MPTTNEPRPSGWTLQDRRLDDAMHRGISGDPAALDTVCRLLAPRLRPFFLRRTHCADASDDLVQETLLRVLSARSRFTPGARAMPWVFTIARRLLVDRRRARRFEEVTFDPDRHASGPSPDALVASADTARRLGHALEQLPVTHRVAFELVRGEGLSVADAADRLATTRCAIKLRTHRATRALRAKLEAA